MGMMRKNKKAWVKSPRLFVVEQTGIRRSAVRRIATLVRRGIQTTDRGGRATAAVQHAAASVGEHTTFGVHVFTCAGGAERHALVGCVGCATNLSCVAFAAFKLAPAAISDAAALRGGGRTGPGLATRRGTLVGNPTAAAILAFFADTAFQNATTAICDRATGCVLVCT